MSYPERYHEIKIQVCLNPKPTGLYNIFKPHFLIYKMRITICIHMYVMVIRLNAMSEQAQWLKSLRGTCRLSASPINKLVTQGKSHLRFLQFSHM